jgi:hypothetical protein
MALPASFLLWVEACGGARGQGPSDARDDLVVAEPRDIVEVVRWHVVRYPEMRLEDLEKLVYQAAVGPEHGAPSPEEATLRLAEELSQLTAEAGALLDPVSPGGPLVRVHLRPFLRRACDEDALVRAFLRAARTVRGGPADVERLWDRVAAAAGDSGALPWSRDELDRAFAQWRAGGLRAVHHSTTFTARYRPAYRVIREDDVARLGCAAP